MVRQPMGEHRPLGCRPAPPQALSADPRRTLACQRALRELRPEGFCVSRRSSRDAQPEGMVPSLAPWLIRLAARSAPASLAERLEEEWLADLPARRGPVARLRPALRGCWGARVITHEHAVVNLLGAAAAAGHKIMSGSAQHDSSFFSRRTTAVLLIVCLHGLLICGLAVGLGPIIHVMPPDISATVLPGPSKPPGSPPPFH